MSMWNGAEHSQAAHTGFPFMYPAEVVNGTDPADADSGRVQVRVFPMMAGLATTVLPWAVPAFPLVCGAGTNRGAWAVPVTGSRVWVFFAGGDPMNPVYWAEAPGAGDGPTGRTVAQRIVKTPAGHTVTLDDTSGSEKISIEHSSGHTVEISGDEITVEHSGGSTIVIDATDVTVTAQTQVKLLGAAGVGVTGGVVCAGNPAHICAFTGGPHPAGSANVVGN